MGFHFPRELGLSPWTRLLPQRRRQSLLRVSPPRGRDRGHARSQGFYNLALLARLRPIYVGHQEYLRTLNHSDSISPSTDQALQRFAILGCQPDL